MGYYSSSDSDDYATTAHVGLLYTDSSNNDAFSVYDVQCVARDYGYTQCQHGRGEGVLDFRRADANGDSEIVRVWYRTGTVGTYIKHPRAQQRTQLFRRDNTQISELHDIFNNPRVHTGCGYHRRGDQNTPYQRRGDRNTPCPSCGRMHRGMLGAVQHFESGSCPNCPNREDACRAVHGLVNQVGSHMVVQQIGWDSVHTTSFDPNGLNYRCPCCGRQTRTMQALMQHMNARPECRSGASGIAPSLAQLAY